MPSPNIDEFRVGIVGAGWVAGARHLPGLLGVPGVRLAVVCDRRLETARRLASRGGSPTAIATTSLDEVIAAKPRLVSVCTPPFVRKDIAVALLDAGIPVFLEKPMAMNEAEALEIADASKRSDTLVCVSHNFLFSRSMQRVERALRSGKVGAVQQVIAVQTSSPRRRLPSWYPSLPAGLLFDESPHLLYLIHSVIGDAAVMAVNTVPYVGDSDQPVRSLQAILASDVAPAIVSMTFAAPVSEWHLLIVTERAVLAVDLFRDISVIVGSDGSHRGKDILATSLGALSQHAAGVVSSASRIAAKRQSWGHFKLIEEVIEAVKSGNPSPVPIEDSLRVVRTLDRLVADYR